MTTETARALAELLDDDDTFAWFADKYVDVYESGGGLEDVVATLWALSEVAA